MLTSDFDYLLPAELIAQEPVVPRDSCRLLVLHRRDGSLEHKVFTDIIDYLDPGDLLVANNTRVLPARLLGQKEGTGGAAEMLLLRRRAQAPDDSEEHWEALVKPGRRLKPGARVVFTGADGAPVLTAQVDAWVKDGQRGERVVCLHAAFGTTVTAALQEVGKTPLPPYITSYAGEGELYQTVFSQIEKSAAAPTAGLHFTTELLHRIAKKGVAFETVELEVGLDTFRTVDEEHIEAHHIHTERYSVSQAVIDAVERTQAAGGRVIAVGTTSVRSLESAWDVAAGRLLPRHAASTALYITPGYRFNVIDALVTNFHVPRSTLLMLVSALASREQILAAYSEAIAQRYRLLSFGDAMLID